MTGSLRRAHVKEYDIYRLNLTSLNDTALGGLLDGPSVASLCLDQCVVRSLFVGDSFLAKCTEKRVTSLSINENELVDGRPFQPRASVEALLDFCTRTANAGNAEASFQLSLLLTDNLFLHRFLKVRWGMLVICTTMCGAHIHRQWGPGLRSGSGPES